MDQDFQRLGDVANDIKDDVFELVFNVFSQIVTDIFDVAGDPLPWKPLALSTIRDRYILGGDALPIRILVRSGKLRQSLTDPHMGPQMVEVRQLWGVDTVQGGNELNEFQTGQASYKWWFQTLDERFGRLNQVRPMLPTDQMFEQAMKDNEVQLVALVERKLKW